MAMIVNMNCAVTDIEGVTGFQCTNDRLPERFVAGPMGGAAASRAVAASDSYHHKNPRPCYNYHNLLPPSKD